MECRHLAIVGLSHAQHALGLAFQLRSMSLSAIPENVQYTMG